MDSTEKSDSPSSPFTSRSGFMRHRKRSAKHPITLLRKPGIAKELRELHYEEQEYTSSSSVGSTTSQLVSDDSGIDVSQDNGKGHSYFLRKRYTNPF
ncbi:uncharacterized protein [Drosophila kikkawai]|uniref:Uncharacterized protein n=1 Tax=Drosophila kikkawai TaxID=30033 RepID=A0A6P4HXT9_DROKI|nr:uncharacterized protein LOC108073422 [Drosophila kikkawai]KAH8342005.1 hypothetical protein KR059_008447 [Drosophila kikkawai]